jgi:hypothetical protein
LVAGVVTTVLVFSLLDAAPSAAGTAKASDRAAAAPAPASASASAPCTVAERPDRVSAMLTARVQGSRVEILSEQTETSSTFANPDGTSTVEQFAGPVRSGSVVRAGRGGMSM